MKWRWVVAILVWLIMFDALMGFVAYNSETWNLQHDKLLTKWDAVWEVCFVIYPIIAVCVAIMAGSCILTARWADKGGKKK